MSVFNSVKDMRARGFTLRDRPLNIISYDPAGDGTDRDSYVLVSREEWRRGELWDPDLAVELVFRVLLAHRMPIDWELPDKVAHLMALNRGLNRWRRVGKEHDHIFCIETNGVGYGIASAMRSKLAVPVMPFVRAGGGADASVTSKRLSVPRLPALDLLRSLLELHRLKAVRNGPGIDLLFQEMNALVWRGKGRPEAMHGAQDDLVMALSGACWIGSKVIPPLVKQQRFTPRGTHATPKGTSQVRVH